MLQSNQWKGVWKKHVFIYDELLHILDTICMDKYYLVPQSEHLCPY